jgi:glutamate-1-semialdehyde 2,1-aminomutase
MLRSWTYDHGVLLVLDEVITFRLGFSGAQEVFKVKPDLTALAKIIGGGFPVGAVAGQTEIMSVLDHRFEDNPFPHGGTFNSNPITMTAGLTAMNLMTPEMFEHINRLGEKARQELGNAMTTANVSGQIMGAGSIFHIHLKDKAFTDYRSMFRSPAEQKAIRWLIDNLLEKKMMLAVTGMGCISTPMTDAEIDALAEASLKSFRELRKTGLLDQI